MKHLTSAAAVAALLTIGSPARPGHAEETPAPMPPGTEAAAREAGERKSPDPRDQQIEDLKRLVEQLAARVSELEKRPAQPVSAAGNGSKPAVCGPGAPGAPAQPQDPAGAPPAADPQPAPGRNGRPLATLLPDISVIGNLIARGGDSKAIPGRGRSHLQELEVALQDAVAPKLRYDVFFAAEKEEEWSVHLEEGYVTASALLPGLNARAGKMRTPVGRFNPLHPHSWWFITQPSAHAYLVGDHGLLSDGAVLQYVLPTRGFFAGLEFGAWQTSDLHHGEEEGHEEEEEHDEDKKKDHDKKKLRPLAGNKKGKKGHGGAGLPHELGFGGGEHGAYSTRLTLGKELGRDRELEFGASRYWGRGEVEGFERRRMLALNALDLSYRSYPGGDRRLWLLAELLAHETRGVRGETKLRPGGFLMAAYRWNRYWEGGVRGDYTKLPFPFDGHERGVSLFLTRFLTEQTSLRMEYRHANTPGFGDNNGIFFQLLFGSGPHRHRLE